VNKARKAHGAARHVKYGFGFRASADHVHVDDSCDALGEFGLAVEQGHGAFDFGREKETDGAGGGSELLVVDQLLQRAGDFEDGGAAAGVVVGSGPLVVEVATEGDLFLLPFGVGAGNGSGHDFVVARMLSRFDHGAQRDFFSAGEAGLQGVSRFEGDHEGECLVGRKRVEVAPADGGLVFTGPGGFADGEILHGARLRAGEDEFALDHLARIVGFPGTRADVDQFSRYIRAFAVFGQDHGFGFITGDHRVVGHGDGSSAGLTRHRHLAALVLGCAAALSTCDLPEFREIRVPGRAGALCAVEDPSVGRKLEDGDVA
jgi:hypothetical protein